MGDKGEWVEEGGGLGDGLIILPSLSLDTCTFKMAKEHLKVSELFPMLNREKARLGILDWGVKMTTLEDGKHVCTYNKLSLIWTMATFVLRPLQIIFSSNTESSVTIKCCILALKFQLWSLHNLESDLLFRSYTACL